MFDILASFFNCSSGKHILNLLVDDMKPPSSFLQAMEEYVKDAPQGPIVRKDQVLIDVA